MKRVVNPKRNKYLTRYGFNLEHGGAHLARTMMLKELQAVLTAVDDSEADKSKYQSAIIEGNCLGKRSGKTRLLTWQHLVALYSLDRTYALFRALLYFWKRDPSAQPLLALLCTSARDPLFRSTIPFIQKFSEGEAVARTSLEAFIEKQKPGRFSKATLKSTAQNINSTWTQSGHLVGRARKLRSHAKASAGSVSYSLFIAYLQGVRGQALFQTEHIRLLDCTFAKAVELAEEASRKGWIIFKRIHDVIEVQFPNLINKEEMEWLREQNQTADTVLQ